jgi:intracellular sulfur oxidation DsrE/DsrF family protein
MGWVILLALLAHSGAAGAGPCLVTGPRYQLATDTADWLLRIGSGQSCTRGFRFSYAAIENATLVLSPHFGEVTLQGTSFTYTANPDYEGEDAFDVLISGSINRIPGSSTIRVKVRVVSAPPQQALPITKESELATAQKVAIQVDERDDTLMNLALNNAKNLIDFYKAKGETVAVEIVTFGPGLHMLRADTSPVKDRISAMVREHPQLSFAACGNTQASMSKMENKPITLIREANITTSGVVRLIELQEQGYAYLRP